MKLVVIENGLIDNLFLRVYTYINNSKRVDEYGIIRSLKSATNEVIETLEYTSETTPNNKLRKRIKRLNLGEK